MASEIDNFIRDQKSKIQAERVYLDKFKEPESIPTKENESSSFIFKMNEGENMKNKYKQELRNDFSVAPGVDDSPRRSRKENKNDDGLLPGLRYSNSANVRKEKQRNKEYNEFKRMQEQKFKNRFSDKKSRDGGGGDNDTSLERNPIVKPENQQTRERSLSRERRPERVETAIAHYPEPRFQPKEKGRVVESKLEELERKVEELRNFRVQNPFIVYPAESSHVAPRYQEPPPQNDLRYSSTNLGRSHLRFLDDVEKKLEDIETRYSHSKSEIINRYKSPRKPVAPMPSILDDDFLFEEDRLGKKPEASYVNGVTRRTGSPEVSSHGIVPLGPSNAEEIKRQKQETYRRDLERQMSEKQKSGRNKDSDYMDNSDLFFDKFTNGKGMASSRRNDQARGRDAQTHNDSTDYDFYSSHNPLDFNPTEMSDSIISRSSRKKEDFSLRDSKARPEFSSISNLSHRNQDDGSNSKRGEYADELKRQIEERRRQKEQEKRRVEEFERKKNEEIANYNPFGRGGGGAPLKNNKGENVADLRRVLHGDDSSPRQVYTEPPPPVTAALGTSRHTPRVNFAVSPRTGDPADATFARGGHGIFGQALTQEDKERADRYKDELQAQIVEKRRQKELEKEQERIRDQNEQRKIEEQQREIQIQFEKERAIQQQKEQEKQRALEETRQAALQQKKKRQRTPPPSPRNYPPPDMSQQQRRNSSPILQDKTATEIEAVARPAPIKREDSRIMGQIDNLRSQLENEKQRIELALLRQKDEVEIYDPRLHEAKRPAAKHKPEKKTGGGGDDVFQAVLDKKGPLSVRRNKPREAPPTPSAESGTGDLEEYLREQERILQRMTKNDFSNLELNMPKMNPHDMGLGRPSTQNSMQLDADTDFIQFYGSSNDFGMPGSSYPLHDFARPPTRPLSGILEPASLRRPSSSSSLNIEELTRKNKERLRKLKRLQDENGSQQSNDEILNRVITNSDLADTDTDFLTYRK